MESAFTSLPGIDRKLIILEGAICITHEGHYSKHLKPFEVDMFNGDWKTTAKGLCTDFNVMTAGQQQCRLYHIVRGANTGYTLKPKESCTNLFLYVTSGKIHLQLLEVSYILKTGELLVIENSSVSSIAINSNEDFGLVVVEIHSSF